MAYFSWYPGWLALLVSGMLIAACSDGDPVTTDTSPPSPAEVATRPDPMMLQAGEYIEARSQEWLDTRSCALSCHTTLPYLMTNPFSTPDSRALAERIRDQVEPRVEAWPDVSPFYPTQPLATEAVLNAVALVYYDRNVQHALSPLTCQAVGAMWEAQSADGSFGWWSFNLQPFELAESNFWAGAMVSRAVAQAQPLLTSAGLICDPLAADSAALAKLHGWLEAQQGATDTHGRSWLLWADQAWDETLLSPETRAAIFGELREKQRADGGFGLLDFLPAGQASQSDGYMSSLMGLLLARSADDANQPAREDLDGWMKANHSMEQLQQAASPNKPGVDRNDGLFTDTSISYWMLYTTPQETP